MKSGCWLPYVSGAERVVALYNLRGTGEQHIKEGKNAMNTSDDAALDEAAQIIADARVECLKLGVSPKEIADIMMDEATVGLMTEGKSLSEIQTAFRKYSKKSLPKFYAGIRGLAEQ